MSSKPQRRTSRARPERPQRCPATCADPQVLQDNELYRPYGVTARCRSCGGGNNASPRPVVTKTVPPATVLNYRQYPSFREQRVYQQQGLTCDRPVPHVSCMRADLSTPTLLVLNDAGETDLARLALNNAKQQKKLPFYVWGPIALQVLDAVRALHALQPAMAHRDVKPGNFVLNPATGAVTLVDLGSACVAAKACAKAVPAGTMGFYPASLDTMLAELGDDHYYYLTQEQTAFLPPKVNERYAQWFAEWAAQHFPAPSLAMSVHQAARAIDCFGALVTCAYVPLAFWVRGRDVRQVGAVPPDELRARYLLPEDPLEAATIMRDILALVHIRAAPANWCTGLMDVRTQLITALGVAEPRAPSPSRIPRLLPVWRERQMPTRSPPAAKPLRPPQMKQPSQQYGSLGSTEEFLQFERQLQEEEENKLKNDILLGD